MRRWSLPSGEVGELGGNQLKQGILVHFAEVLSPFWEVAVLQGSEEAVPSRLMGGDQTKIYSLPLMLHLLISKGTWVKQCIKHVFSL